MAARRGWYVGQPLTQPRIGRYSVFEYPKLKGLRPMAILPIVDRLVAHTVIARIGADIEAVLSDRMHANRLAKTGAGWTLHKYDKAHLAYRRQRLASLAENRWRFTCITDLRNFYPSIRRDLLTADLRTCTKHGDVVGVVGEQLAVWQERDKLAGLPIGDSAFGVLASAVLAPLDAALQRVSGDHHSYSDDTTFFTISDGAGQLAYDALAEAAAERGLTLNDRKTYRYTDPAAAVDAITNEALDYAEFLLEIFGDLAQEKVHDVWDAVLASGEISEPGQLTNIHFGLARMGRPRDLYGVHTLIGRLDIMQATPRKAIDYLLSAAPDHPAVYEVMLRIIGDPVTRTNQGLTLHALRYLEAWPRSDDVLAPCVRILADARLHPLVRSWAAVTMRRAPSWSCMDTLERAETEPDYSVCRAALASTRGSDDRPHVRRHLLEDIKKSRPDMAATCDYALRAA